MIIISSELFDLRGVLILPSENAHELGGVARRVNRVPVLNLNVAVRDRGSTHADRTFFVRYAPISKAHDDRARHIVMNHKRVRVGTTEGAFLACPSSFDPTETENTLTLLILQKLSED